MATPGERDQTAPNLNSTSSPTATDFMMLIQNMNGQLEMIHKRFDVLENNLGAINAGLKDKDEKFIGSTEQ